MAIKLIKKDNLGFGTYQEFIIDSEADLEDIEDGFDCELGDKAITPSGEIYIRHSDNFDGDLWVLASEQGSSDEGGSGTVGEFIVTFTYSSQQDTWGFTNTYADIYNAAANGTPIWMYTADASSHESPILVRMNVQEFSDPEAGIYYVASTHYIPVEWSATSLQMDFFQFKFEASMDDGEAYVEVTVNKVEMVGVSPK